MKFAWRMALRELRRGRRRFVFFILCIAIGVAGLVGVKGFNASLQRALLREARPLMAADMSVSLNKPASADEQAVLDSLKGQGIQIVHTTETVSMAINPGTKATSMVQVKAVEPGYPFYGTLELNPPGAALRDDTALVGSDLFDRLGLKEGDTLKLGTATYTITGVIVNEPDNISAGLSAGPRVMLTRGGLDRAGLITTGSRATEKWLLKLQSDSQVEPVREQLTTAFKPDRGRVADFREASPQIKRFLDRMTSFLSLVSMVALLVGGLGVANAARVFIQQKLDTIAIMKCVGATNRRVVWVYLTQMSLLGLAGSVLGITLGYAVQLVMPQVVGNFLNLTLDLTLSPVVAVQGLVVGMLTAILFTLLPLTAIAEIKPALVFRREMAEQRPRTPRQTLVREGVLLTVVAAGLALIAAWVSGRLAWGLWFTAGLAGAVLILGLASAAAVRAVRLIKPPRRWLTVRQGLASLYRPGSQAGAIVLALGIGVTMVLAVYILQSSLMAEVKTASPAGAPNMIFLNLSSADEPAFRTFLTTHTGVLDAPAPIPLARGRLQRIDGKTKQELDLTEQEQRWFDYEFNFTYSEKLPEGNQLVAGAWWTPADYANTPLVSVEQESATRLHLQVGSTVEAEVQGGVPVKAKVFNIRKSTGFSAGGNFNFVFAPDGMKDVPVSYVAQAKVEPSAAGAITRDAVAKFPSLTIIDVGQMLTTVGTLLDRIGLVIRFVAGFSVAAGLIILASSIAATKFRRTREAVLFKTLGATRGRVWRIFAVEYATLGLVAGVVGAVLSALAGWAVLKWVLDVQMHVSAWALVAGVGITVVLTVAVGVLSTLDVLAAKPLEVLRQE